jgi:GTP-binding protein
MFVDQIKVHARAGKGGDGSKHFYRGKFKPKGGPDGGDGGDGGDVILLVDPSTSSLRKFFFNGKLVAEDGQRGGENQRTGRGGEDGVYHVPPGLQITRLVDRFNEESGEVERVREFVVDLTEVGQRYVLCKGGKGGKGNVHFKTSTHQAPEEFEPGGEPEEGDYHFELKSIAGAGMVGFPNAGKSTLLARLTGAKPKIGNYPFTTLKPMVGVMNFPNFRRGTLADIPGLIEGAHADVGLGHDFLRHISRCSVLLFVVDAAGSEGRDPVEDVQTLRRELELYSAELATRPWVILANKTDLPEAAEHVPILKKSFKGVKLFPLSANEGDGLDQLRVYLDETIGQNSYEF